MTVREQLIEILRKPIFPHELVDPTEAVADYLLDNGVTVQRWIPVTERLPKEDGLVLAIVDGRHGNIEFVEAYMIAEFFPGRGWILEDCPDALDFEVTCWQPLPNAPVKEERE